MYIVQILWLLALPVMIFLAYRLVIYALKKYEQKYPPDLHEDTGRNS
jgi:hypothetical protein